MAVVPAICIDDRVRHEQHWVLPSRPFGLARIYRLVGGSRAQERSSAVNQKKKKSSRVHTWARSILDDIAPTDTAIYGVSCANY